MVGDEISGPGKKPAAESPSPGDKVKAAITPEQERQIVEGGGTIVRDAEGNVGVEGLTRSGVVEILGGAGASGTPQELRGTDTTAHYGDGLAFIDTHPDRMMTAQGVEDGGGVRFELVNPDMQIWSEYFGMEGVGVVRALQGNVNNYETAVWLYPNQDTVTFSDLGARVSFGKVLTTNEHLNSVRSQRLPIPGGHKIESWTPSVWHDVKQGISGRADRAAEMWNQGGLGYIGAPIEFISSPLTGAMDVHQSYYRGRNGRVTEGDRQTTDVVLFVAGAARSVVTKAGAAGSATRLAARADGTTIVASSARADAIDYLRRSGITDPTVRGRIADAGFDPRILGPDTPDTIARANKLFGDTFKAGKKFAGRLGNIETRVATINKAAELERRGLDVAFEFRVPVGKKPSGENIYRFLDLVGLDGKQPVELYQFVREVRPGVVSPREAPAAALIEAALGRPVKQITVGR